MFQLFQSVRLYAHKNHRVRFFAKLCGILTKKRKPKKNRRKKKKAALSSGSVATVARSLPQRSENELALFYIHALRCLFASHPHRLNRSKSGTTNDNSGSSYQSDSKRIEEKVTVQSLFEDTNVGRMQVSSERAEMCVRLFFESIHQMPTEQFKVNILSLVFSILILVIMIMFRIDISPPYSCHTTSCNHLQYV